MASEDYEDTISEEIENIPNETREEAFLRLVNKRLPAAVKRLRLLRNLAKGANYQYSPQQAGQVVALIRTELEELERAFFSADDDDDIPEIR